MTAQIIEPFITPEMLVTGAIDAIFIIILFGIGAYFLSQFSTKKTK